MVCWKCCLCWKCCACLLAVLSLRFSSFMNVPNKLNIFGVGGLFVDRYCSYDERCVEG